MSSLNPKVRFLRANDGVRIAWAEAGEGPTLIKAANWLTHLEYERTSPVWKHWLDFFSTHFLYIRYDERGCGMTDHNTENLSIETWVDDLDAVANASDPKGPFILLGISQGAATCIAYALAHPKRVSKLILYGGYARGTYFRGDPDAIKLYKAMVDLVSLEWGSDNPAFRQVFTSRFAPGASHEQIEWFNDLCRKTTSAEAATVLLEARAKVNIIDMLEKVETPTLVLHARDDKVAPIEEGRILASQMPNAAFVELDTANHVLLENEPAWTHFCEEVLRFAEIDGALQSEDAVFATLTRREREVLSLITEGLGNAEIGDNLGISEKTVRNHVSNIFDKLGVWSRSQALVFARDRHFNATIKS